MRGTTPRRVGTLWASMREQTFDLRATRGAKRPWSEHGRHRTGAGTPVSDPAAAAGRSHAPLDRPLGARPGRPARPDDRNRCRLPAHPGRHRLRPTAPGAARMGPLAGFYGLYKRDRVGADNATLDEVWPIFNCVTVASFAVFAIVQAFGPRSLHGGRVVAFWALASVAIPAYRSIARTLLRRQLALKQRAVVVGAGLVGQEIARKVLRQPSYGLDLVGFVDPNPLPAARGAAASARPGLDRRSGRVAGHARHRPRRVGVYRRSSGRPGRRPGL